MDGKGWTAAGELKPGDNLLAADKTRLPVENVSETGDTETVYNFRVADWHTYFVGEKGWDFEVWVHNACAPGANAANQTTGPNHHIATNKNWISNLTEGPWSPRFKKIFDEAGMTLDDAANKVRIPGHVGPHPHAYHQEIFDRLKSATDELTGETYKAALLEELKVISLEASSARTRLNNLITGVK